MMRRSIVGINTVIVVCFTIILVYQKNLDTIVFIGITIGGIILFMD